MPLTETLIPMAWPLCSRMEDRKIGPMAYHLKLPHWIKQLHPVFNVVKLTLALDDPITERKTEDHPPP